MERRKACPSRPSASVRSRANAAQAYLSGPSNRKIAPVYGRRGTISFGPCSPSEKGRVVVVTDVCVPISRLAECVIETKRDIEASGLIAPIVGHAGDGNFHAGIAVMMEDAEEVDRTRAFLDRLAERSLDMEGTCTGEHGIGQGKKHFLGPEHGAAAVETMRAIKHALDPSNIMNPGKIV